MILITGGAGFIGGNFIHYLHNNHKNVVNKVVCIDSLEYSSNLEYIQPLIDNGFVDFYKRDIYLMPHAEELDQYQFEYIFNFAALTHVDNSIKCPYEFLLTNEMGTYYLLEWARLTQTQLKKFIHISTDEVYGSLSSIWEDAFTEESTYQPNSPYSASKASSDHWVRAYHSTYGLPTIVTNCSNNYGPNQHEEKLIPKVISNALNDKPIPVYGNGQNIRDWLYVEDHCRALYMVMTKGEVGQKYNIGGGKELLNIDLIKKILDLMNKPHSLIEYVEDRPGHDYRYAINGRKIEQELGYRPEYSLDWGLKKTIGWYTNGRS